MPLFAFTAVLVEKCNVQAGTQYRLGAQRVLEFGHQEFRCIEIFGIGPEAHAGAGVLLTDLTDRFEFGHFVAVGEGHAEYYTAAPHPYFELLRQRIDHRHANAVQTAGKTIILIGEFTTGVQPREYHFHARHFFARMHVDRHAAAVVFHFQRAVFIKRHFDTAGVAGDRLVDAIVDHLLGKVIGAAGVGVHTGALAHRFETGQHLDGGGVVITAHGVLWSNWAPARCGETRGDFIGFLTAAHLYACRRANPGVAAMSMMARGRGRSGAGAGLPRLDSV